MKQIKTVEQVVRLAGQGKSVAVHYGGGKTITILPAAWVANYQARYLVGILKAGMVFENKKTKK